MAQGDGEPLTEIEMRIIFAVIAIRAMLYSIAVGLEMRVKLLPRRLPLLKMRSSSIGLLIPCMQVFFCFGLRVVAIYLRLRTGVLAASDWNGNHHAYIFALRNVFISFHIIA